MSEHYDFHYQPTGSGAISGQQVLEQTEDAINELGDYVNDNVGGAMDVAQQALETAQNAEQDAQTALDTANSFSSAIQSAQQDASTALSTAQTAQTTASNANNTAIQAQQDASSAVTTANNASGQVSTLSGTVTTLGQRVTTAEGNIGQNTSDITALTTRVGTAEGNITTLQNDVTIAQGNASSAMATAGTVKQQAYVFRYSSTALTPSSTNSNALLDNTDNLKVGDKVIDSNGVLFSITAIDTANSTFTIGTSLIDLAQDSDVVHKSGSETISGNKTFSSNVNVYNSDATATTPNLYLRSSKIEISSQGNTSGDQNLTYLDKNNTTYAYVKGAIQSNGSAVKIRAVAKDGSDNSVVNELQLLAYTNGNKSIFPSYSNEIDLGTSSYKWKSVYATNYYYGSNNVEFSDKFVTTDTNQTVDGLKTFPKGLRIYNTNTSDNTSPITLRTAKVSRGSTTDGGDSLSVMFNDRVDSLLASVRCTKVSNGTTQLRNIVNTTDTSDNIITCETQLNIAKNGDKSFIPSEDSQINLGSSSYRWKSFNGVEPSSLSLPSGNVSNFIDISSYFSNTGTGEENSYTASANGWIYLRLGSISSCQAAVYDANNDRVWGQSSTGGVEQLTIPILKGQTLSTQWNTSSTVTVAYARFIPCQGNI